MSGPFVEALVNPVTLSATTTHLSDSPLLGPPGVFCISPFTLPHALRDLCLSDIVLQ